MCIQIIPDIPTFFSSLASLLSHIQPQDMHCLQTRPAGEKMSGERRLGRERNFGVDVSPLKGLWRGVLSRLEAKTATSGLASLPRINLVTSMVVVRVWEKTLRLESGGTVDWGFRGEGNPGKVSHRMRRPGSAKLGRPDKDGWYAVPARTRNKSSAAGASCDSCLRPHARTPRLVCSMSLCASSHGKCHVRRLL